MTDAETVEMTDLYREARHEPHSGMPWDEDAARTWLRDVVRRVEGAFQGPDRLWPAHSRDAEVYGLEGTLRSVFAGAGGTLVALDTLAGRGCPLERDYRGVLRELPDAHRGAPDFELDPPTMLAGSVGLDTLAETISPSEARRDAILEELAALRDVVGRGTFHGVAGALHVALNVFEHSGDARFADRWRTLAGRLIAAWRRDAGDDASGLWRHQVGEFRLRITGAAHGSAGNVHALVRGAELLDDADRDEVFARAAAAFSSSAVTDRARRFANWPVVVGEVPEGIPAAPDPWLCWSEGAPGIMISLAGVPMGLDETLDATLDAAARLVWKAGAHVDDGSLSRGTAGQIAALLAHHRRTADDVWLERARALAGDAIRVWHRRHAAYSIAPHASAWHGDLSLALAVSDAIEAAPPTVPGLTSLSLSAERLGGVED